jgi:CIC family chloride channel protein
MGSFFAGLLRSPIAAVLIVVELTRDYDLIIPLMLGVSLAVAISRRISKFSVVEQQMIDEGWVEGHDAADPLANVLAADAMTRDPVSMNANANVLEAVRSVAGTHHRFYPIVDDDGRLAGVIPRDAIDKVVREGGAERPLREIMEQPKLVASADENVIEVVRRMRMNGADRCPVVDASDRLVGFLSPGDILRARMQNAPAGEEEHFELFD